MTGSSACLHDAGDGRGSRAGGSAETSQDYLAAVFPCR
jgi:hypothetical protein